MNTSNKQSHTFDRANGENVYEWNLHCQLPRNTLCVLRSVRLRVQILFIFCLCSQCGSVRCLNVSDIYLFMCFIYYEYFEELSITMTTMLSAVT